MKKKTIAQLTILAASLLTGTAIALLAPRKIEYKIKQVEVIKEVEVENTDKINELQQKIEYSKSLKEIELKSIATINSNIEIDLTNQLDKFNQTMEEFREIVIGYYYIENPFSPIHLQYYNFYRYSLYVKLNETNQIMFMSNTMDITYTETELKINIEKKSPQSLKDFKMYYKGEQ